MTTFGRALTFGLALASASAVYAVGAAPTLSAQRPQSIWDGIFTQEQADRGNNLYAQYCAACHSQDLNGGEIAPPLAGGQFVSNWNTLSVGEFFERVRVSMPGDNPGGLSRQQYADILAFVFLKNGFPAGKTELSIRKEMLDQITIQSQKPQ